MTQQQTSFPTPQGTKDNPIKRSVRIVSPGSNNQSLLIGIPKMIRALADITPSTEFNVYMEWIDPKKNKYRIILEH